MTDAQIATHVAKLRPFAGPTGQSTGSYSLRDILADADAILHGRDGSFSREVVEFQLELAAKEFKING